MEILHAIAGIRSPFLDTLFGIITMLGEETILILVFCALFWCISKRMAYVMGAVFFVSSLMVQGLKVVFRVPRPWISDPTFTPVEAALEYATGYAFPSGHTQTGAAWLGSLGVFFKRKWLAVLMFVLAGLVGFSRMYLGVHTISDVIVSLVITFGVLACVMWFFNYDEMPRGRLILLAAIMAGLGVVVIIQSAVMYHTGTVDTANLRDSVIAAAAAIGFAIGMYIERTHINFSQKTKNLGLQAAKYAGGVIGVLAFQEGVRLVGQNLIVDFVRYFLITMWIMVGYPLIIRRVFAVRDR